jgi:hypothetical protein
VREHQGKIFAVSPAPPELLGEVEKPRGSGTLFVVLLPGDWEKPVVDACEELAAFNMHEEMGHGLGEPGKILLLDDTLDAGVMMIQRILDAKSTRWPYLLRRRRPWLTSALSCGCGPNS